MTLDVRSSLALDKSTYEATPSDPLVFRVEVENGSPGTRTYRATAIGLTNAAVSSEPQELRLPPDSVGQIVVTAHPATAASSFPAGRFLVGIQVTDTTGEPITSLLSAEVEVKGIGQVVMSLTEPHLKGLTRARTGIRLQNDADYPLVLGLSGADPGDRLQYRFTRRGERLPRGDVVDLPARSSRAVTVEISGGTKLVGLPDVFAYEIVGRGPGGAVVATGTYTHRALFPPILFKVLLAIAIVIGGMFLTRWLVHRFILEPPVFTWDALPDPEADSGLDLVGRVGHTAVWVEYPRPAPAGFLQRQWDGFVRWFLGEEDQVEGMIVWGGRNEAGDLLKAGAFLRAEDQRWLALVDPSPEANASEPLERADHTALWTGETMAVWGGVIASSGATDDRGAEYDPSTKRWDPLPSGGPSPRVGHTMTWIGDAAVVVGGVDATGAVNRDVWILTPGPLDPREHPNAGPEDRERALTGGSWRRISDLPGPSGARHHHTATWTGRYLVVFGGFDGDGDPLADAYFIEPEVEDAQWMDITRSPKPTPRGCHVALWTGTEVVFLGGTDDPRPVISQTMAGSVCRDTGQTEISSAGELQPEALAVDPEAQLLTPPPPSTPDMESPPEFTWAAPDFQPPQHLGSDFRALWTANEATVIQAVPQLDTVAAVRYSPFDGTGNLPLPDESLIGAVRGFTTVWINGGVIAWGGVEEIDDPPPGGATVRFSNSGALLVLPDR